LAGEVRELTRFAQGARILTDAAEGSWEAVDGRGTVQVGMASGRGQEAEGGSGEGVGTGFGTGEAGAAGLGKGSGGTKEVVDTAPVVTGGG